MSESENKVAVDRKGYVTVVKSEVEAKVVPASLSVWTERGWSLKQESAAEEQPPADVTPETPANTRPARASVPTENKEG